LVQSKEKLLGSALLSGKSSKSGLDNAGSQLVGGGFLMLSWRGEKYIYTPLSNMYNM
jgi:hypothetical protein